MSLKDDEYKVAAEIMKIDKLIKDYAYRLAELVVGGEFAQSAKDYDVAIQTAIEEIEADGGPVSTAKDKAKGRCGDLLQKKIDAEMKIMATKVVLKAQETRMSGMQSLYRNRE